MSALSPARRKQASMEDFLGSPRSAGKAGSKPAGPPPPPPFEEVKGRWVVKTFRDDKTGEVRPFRGQVTRYYKSDGSYKVIYEDGDGEDLDWADVWPLLQRAEAEGVSGPSQPASQLAKKRGRPPKQQQQEKQQQEKQQQEKQQQEERRQQTAQQPPAQQQQQQGPASKAAAATAAAGASPKGLKRKQGGGPEGSSPAKKAAMKSKGGPAGPAGAAGAAGAAAGPAGAAATAAGAAGGRPVFWATARKTVSGKGAAMAGGNVGAAAGAAEAAGAAAAAAAAAAGSSAAVGGAAAGAAASRPAFKTTVRKSVYPKPRKAAAAAGKASAAASKGGAAAGEGAGEEVEGAAAGTKQKKARAPSEPVVELPVPEKDREYSYARGEEPWRSLPHFSYAVHDELDNSAAAVARVRAAQKIFNKHLIQAEVDEEERVSQRIAELAAMGRKAAGEKRPSKRPDRVAESRTKAEGSHISGRKVVGYLPGWPVGSRAYCRAELGCINFHLPPIAGIDFVAEGKAGKGVPSFATSVMVSGWYEDDKDSAQTVWYTGEGGNDLLHSRQQVADQELKRGNKALQGNIALGLPVRVTRKQKSSAYPYGACYVFDGLYDVIRWRLHKGKNGKNVFQFQLRRRPGQGELVSQSVEWGAISVPRKLVPNNRQGVVTLDISGGKEARPIPAIDDTWLTHGDDHEPQGCVPPCTALEDIVDEKALVGKTMRGVNQKRIEQLRAAGYQPSVRYVTAYQYTGKAAEMAKSFKPAELPAEFSASPHEYLKKLNHGKLPYTAGGQLFSVRPVVYECCPEWDCPDGDACPYRLTQRPSKFRLEVYQTGRCGWGVRTLDTIPQFSFVVMYVGEVYEREEHEHLVRTVEERDTEYTMDLCVRPDINWDGSDKTPEEAADHPPPEFVCCGLHARNVAAFVNHSCQPNLFVQPVLTTHHDTRCCAIALFSMENIAPLTELTLDYGEAYVAGWPGGCKCSAVNCVSKRPAGPAAADAGADAAGGQQWQEQGEQEGDAGSDAGEGSGDEEEKQAQEQEEDGEDGSDAE